MKSLQESLFDKDLVQKNLPLFGDIYKPVCVLVKDNTYTRGGISNSTRDDEYKWLLNTIRVSKIKKERESIKIDNKSAKIDRTRYYYDGWKAREDFCELVGYLVDALNNVHVNPEVKSVSDRVVDNSELHQILGPYLKYMAVSRYSGVGGGYYILMDKDCNVSFELYRGDKSFQIYFDKK